MPLSETKCAKSRLTVIAVVLTCAFMATCDSSPERRAETEADVKPSPVVSIKKSFDHAKHEYRLPADLAAALGSHVRELCDGAIPVDRRTIGLQLPYAYLKIDGDTYAFYPAYDDEIVQHKPPGKVRKFGGPAIGRLVALARTVVYEHPETQATDLADAIMALKHELEQL